jgi:hypothetical protein
MAQANHYTTSKADFIKSIAKDPAGAINSGKLKQVKQEVPFGGVGKVVAKVVAKVAEKNAAKTTAKALEAAKGPSLAKGTAKSDATSGMVERNITKMKAETNQILGSSKKEAYTKAAQTMDAEKAKSIAESKKILARAQAEKNAKTIAKATQKP